MTHPSSATPAFATLSRRLLARRFAALEPFVRVALLVLALIAAGFSFWQARLPVHGEVLLHGVAAAARLVAAVLLVLALAAGSLAAGTATWLTRRLPGPAWLALPLTPRAVGRHLLGEARMSALPVAVPAIGVLAAGVGLLPSTWVALLAVAFLVAWLECTRLGAAIAWRLAARRSGVPKRWPLFVRVLAARPTVDASRTRAGARWRTVAAWRAIAAKDRLLTRRSPELFSRCAAAVVFTLLALLSWFAPQPPAGRAALSFGAYLGAMGALGLWAAALVGREPPPLWRPLPVRMLDAWRARATTLLLVGLALPFAGSAFAAGMSVPARAGVALLWWPAGVMVSLLALHHALTLYPEARTAERVTTSWLTVSITTSLMIPLLGWIVLLGGFIHATRRLARGFTSDTR